MRGKWTLTREMQVPKGSVKVADKLSDAVVYLYTTSNGKPAALLFVGKQDKATSRFCYQNEIRRELSVKQAFESRRAQLALKQSYKDERKSFVHDYKIGDILRTSWGYEQTNVEYFQVTDVRGKHVVLREIAAARSEDGYMRGKCTPLPGQFLTKSEPIRRLAQKYGVKICNVRTAWPVESKMVGGVKVYESSNWTAYH